MNERERLSKRELIDEILEELGREVSIDIAMDIAVLVWDAGWRPRAKRADA